MHISVLVFVFFIQMLGLLQGTSFQVYLYIKPRTGSVYVVSGYGRGLIDMDVGKRAVLKSDAGQQCIWSRRLTADNLGINTLNLAAVCVLITQFQGMFDCFLKGLR